MTAFTQNRAFSRISGDTLSLLEEAADQFADDATLVAAIAIWDNKLTAAARKLIGRATDQETWGPLFDYEIMSLVPQAEDGVIGLLKFAQRRRAIMDLPSPAFVLNHRARVLVANESACALLGLADNGSFAQALVDPAFIKTYRELLEACAEPLSATRSAILRLGKDGASQFLFEARAKPDGEQGIIVFRKIGIGLTDVGARFLADAFELTDSEVGVIKLLMEGLQAKEMAIRRNTAEATIRTQLKSIFSKTGTSGQTELMRIVSGISLFQAAKTSNSASKTFLTSRPLSDEGKLVELQNGHFVQVNESGAAGGKPFLSLHGLFLGYAFPAVAEDLLIKNGLRRFGIMRPGFGRSTPVETGVPLGDIVDRFADVMDQLGIDKCPVVAHGFGGAHAFAFAHRHPDRVSALVLVGAFLPAAKMASVIRLSGFQRALMFAAQHSPAMFSFFARTAERVLERDGIIEFLRRYLGSSKADIEILSRHETESSIRMRLNLAQAQQIETYRQECILQISDLSAYARHPGVPTIVIHGTEDPVFPVDLARKAAAAVKVDRFQELPDCGQLILYARPDVAVEAIAQYS